LRKSNPFLRSLTDVEIDAALLVAARTSSAVEGIHGVFPRTSSKENASTSAAPVSRRRARGALRRR